MHDEWTVERWLASLPICGVLSEALGKPSFADVSALTPAEVRRRLGAADVQEALGRAIDSGIARLRDQAAPTGSSLNSKFALEASYQMAFGELGVFYGGLEGLIGPPTFREGSLERAVEMEHCEPVT